MSSALSVHCSRTMTCAFLLPLGISAALIILDLGTHCFMGPLGLVLEGLLFTYCTLCFELDYFWLTDTSGLTPFGFGLQEATTVLFF